MESGDIHVTDDLFLQQDWAATCETPGNIMWPANCKSSSERHDNGKSSPRNCFCNGEKLARNASKKLLKKKKLQY